MFQHFYELLLRNIKKILESSSSGKYDLDLLNLSLNLSIGFRPLHTLFQYNINIVCNADKSKGSHISQFSSFFIVLQFNSKFLRFRHLQERRSKLTSNQLIKWIESRSALKRKKVFHHSNSGSSLAASKCKFLIFVYMNELLFRFWRHHRIFYIVACLSQERWQDCSGLQSSRRFCFAFGFSSSWRHNPLIDLKSWGLRKKSYYYTTFHNIICQYVWHELSIK